MTSYNIYLQNWIIRENLDEKQNQVELTLLNTYWNFKIVSINILLAEFIETLQNT